MDAKQQLASTHKESWGQVGGAELTPNCSSNELKSLRRSSSPEGDKGWLIHRISVAMFKELGYDWDKRKQMKVEILKLPNSVNIETMVLF